MIRALWLLLALGLLACDAQGPLLPARNQCFDDTPCGRRIKCDRVLLRCARDKTEEAYPLFVRITAGPPSGMLAEAGVELVPEVVRDLRSLTDRRDAEVLRVPGAVNVMGEVTAELDGGTVAALLHSQVTIVPTGAVVPTAARVVETRAETLRGDAGTPANLSVQLDPDHYYDLRVQPLSSASTMLPPYGKTDVGSDQLIKLPAPTVEGRSGRFVYREASQYVLFARLEEQGTGRVISSTAPVKTTLGTTPSGEERREGVFTLYADPDVFTSRNFELVVSLGGFAPWQVTIRIDSDRFLAGGDMALPSPPPPVLLANVVENQERQPLANSEIIFVSTYEIPPPVDPLPPNPEDETPPGTPTALDADWCRLLDPERVACRGRFQTVSNAFGEYSIKLIPGLYDVYVIPHGGPNARNVVVTRHEDPEKPGMPFLVGKAVGEQALLLQANSATPYTGTIYALNAPAARVTLHAMRLPTPLPSSWGPIADFNRTLSVISDRKGHYSLAPDVGFYDFVFEPEQGSDLPWKLWLDCPNGPGAGGSQAPVELTAPVLVLGSVEHEETGIKLPNAKIEAFTIVESEHREPRSVMIGRTVSDDKGDYILALPPSVGEQNGRCKGTVPATVTGNGRSTR